MQFRHRGGFVHRFPSGGRVLELGLRYRVRIARLGLGQGVGLDTGSVGRDIGSGGGFDRPPSGRGIGQWLAGSGVVVATR